LGASKGVVVQTKNDSDPNDKFDDEDYPAYSMGSAAQMLGTTPGFLRSLDEPNSNAASTPVPLLPVRMLSP
jgi:hypothetical protein